MGVETVIKIFYNDFWNVSGRKTIMPKISVILSAYNAEKYIRQAIGSILSQTMRDFEFFIVNDASTDSTAEIISSFNDSRIIRIENKTNKGAIESLNACMNLAKGEYIARMDADDISMPQRFKRQADFLDNNSETGMCGSWIKTFGPTKNYIHKYPCSHADIKFMMLTNNPFPHPGMMLRKKLFDKFKLRYKQDTFPAEDYDFWERAIRCFKTANIPEVLLHYRFHPQNASNTSGEKQRKEADKVRVRQLDRIIGGASDAEAQTFLNLMRKENGAAPGFIDDSLNLLKRLRIAVIEKNEFTADQIDSFIKPCWSYACKTDFRGGMQKYLKGLEIMGINTSFSDRIRQLLRAYKYAIKAGINK